MNDAASSKIADAIKKVAIMGCLAAVAYFGESGTDGGFIKDVWAAAKTASPFAAMFATLAWLDERRERREAQQQCNDRTISFVEATNTQSGAIESMVDAVKQLASSFSVGRRRRAR